MKLTKKMSPLVMGLVAILVGCSMMGAALSVLVSTNPASSVATVTVDKAITLVKSDADISHGLGLWTQDFTYQGDAVTPAVGATYDINITARSSADLPNVMFFFKVTKTGALIDSTDIVVKEYQQNISATHWTQLDLESYGDYVLGTIMVDTTSVTSQEVTAGWSDQYSFMVQFLKTGTYTFDWYAASPSSPVVA